MHKLEIKRRFLTYLDIIKITTTKKIHNNHYQKCEKSKELAALEWPRLAPFPKLLGKKTIANLK